MKTNHRVLNLEILLCGSVSRILTTLELSSTEPILDTILFLGDGFFIIGEGKNFTFIGPEYEDYEAGTVLTINIFSGSVEEDGILNAFEGIVMIENHGISGFIANGTGKVFRDGDGFADLQEWPSAGELNTAAFGTDV